MVMGRSVLTLARGRDAMHSNSETAVIGYSLGVRSGFALCEVSIAILVERI
jgi:hypothetical protein